jgi:hypothetical protein
MAVLFAQGQGMLARVQERSTGPGEEKRAEIRVGTGDGGVLASGSDIHQNTSEFYLGRLPETSRVYYDESPRVVGNGDAFLLPFPDGLRVRRFFPGLTRPRGYYVLEWPWF